MKDLLVKEFKPKSLLNLPDNTPQRARFPVIDAHNHLFGDIPASQLVEALDEAGVKLFLNVTGNVKLPFDESGYTIERRDLGVYLDNYCGAYPGRFAAFTMSDFARWDQFTLFRSEENPGGSPERWTELCIRHLEEDVRRGALGLKLTKELGLQFKDNDGSMLRVNDPRLFPIWRRAGELDIPVLIHTSDPLAFFLPVDRHNEHYQTLQEFVDWSFVDAEFSKEQLLAQRDRLVAEHPGTRFLLPHVANYPEDLEYVSTFLDGHPNAWIDISARFDELGRQPYTAREFMIHYQDRILFGIDMPPRPDIYRSYFRFLETRDEYFEYPDYIGRWGHTRWRIYGLGLPDEVLKKIYYENALRLIPGLAEIYGSGAKRE
jgi:predicted TIM-barrel fold metal-dependent hydrolase